MTVRDRLVVMALCVLAVFALGWFVVVAPERQQASEAEAAVQSAKQQLASAHEQASTAEGAQRAYDSAYSTVVSLGLAVPSSPEVPSLMYELEKASNTKNVEFTSISSASGSVPAPSAPAVAGAGSSFSALPFTFVFEGTYSSLDHLLDELDGFAVPTSSGVPSVTGRLLTIQGLDLSSSGGGANERMTGTVSATAYTLAGGVPVTAGATPAGPTPATNTGSSSSEGAASAPAVIGALK